MLSCCESQIVLYQAKVEILIHQTRECFFPIHLLLG